MKIKIRLKNDSILEYSTEESITTIEMPYMCLGYGFNGSSSADEEDLKKYWELVDKILLINGINKEEYKTLESIENE